MLKNHSSESQKKELYYGQLLFDGNGHPREEFKDYLGKPFVNLSLTGD